MAQAVREQLNDSPAVRLMQLGAPPDDVAREIQLVVAKSIERAQSLEEARAAGEMRT